MIFRKRIGNLREELGHHITKKLTILLKKYKYLLRYKQRYRYKQVVLHRHDLFVCTITRCKDAIHISNKKKKQNKKGGEPPHNYKADFEAYLALRSLIFLDR